MTKWYFHYQDKNLPNFLYPLQHSITYYEEGSKTLPRESSYFHWSCGSGANHSPNQNFSGLWLCFQQRGGHVRLYQGGTHQGCWVTAMNNWRAGRSLPSMKISAYQVHLSPRHPHPSPSFPAVLAEDGHQVLLEKIEDWNVVELMVNGEVVFRCNIKDLEFGKSFPLAFCFL